MKSEKFTTNNPFSMLAYLACEKHIEGQELKNPLGKLDCYIFYSTYVSLLTSYIQLSNADNVDIYLMDGLRKFIDYLEIDVDSLPNFNVEDYIRARSNFFVNYIKEFPKYNFDKQIDYPYFLKCFEMENPYFEDFNYDKTSYIDPFDIMILKLTFAVVLDNINVIDTLYDTFNDNVKDYKLLPWKNNKPKLLSNPFNFIDKLVINPFQECRCNICGDFELRERLLLAPINDSEFGGLILPVCQQCKTKHSTSDDYINF